MASTTSLVRAADGRDLQVLSAGDSAGRPVLNLHGAPGGRRMASEWAEDAARSGIHLIGYDRPGYAGSTAHPQRSIADCVSDVQAIAKSLNLDRVVVRARSAGGPHALALAAMLPDLVGAAAVFCSPAPFDASGLDWFDGMESEDADYFHQFLHDPDAFRVELADERAQWLSLTAEQIAASCPPTIALPFYQDVVAGRLEAVAPGIEGWFDDLQALASPWGFNFDEIGVPIQLWHGRLDSLPFHHSQWLAEQIPGTELHVSDTDGHETVYYNHAADATDWLLQHL